VNTTRGKRLFAIAVLAAAGATAAVIGNARSEAAPIGHIQTWQDLSTACQTSLDPDTGFGGARIDRTITLQNITGNLDVPCIVHLTDGAGFRLHNSKVNTKSIIIADDGDTSSSDVSIQYTTLTGRPDSGLFVQLRHANDDINVQYSTVSYDLSAWLITTNTDDTGAPGNINVTSSSITSRGSTSEGIHLVAGGTANFASDTFSTTATNDEDLAVLYGRAGCTKGTNVTGAVTACTG
jgi:hypothetical protein